ncbi:hypothetical protein [Verrucomicrobium sp. BvORR106]|uniref:hypothetical protein n=1 Tax=Verrucomicrobium sp. BvORR106 TaxID=1403819 RepID=UPI000689FF60|nr:hypothetical protein [Verrucomicrobium sp. BvORR106]
MEDFVPSYEVVDAVEHQKLHAATFELPDEWNRQRLEVGEWGKVMFRFPVNRDPEVERLWVRVTGYTSLGYKGVLDNDASNTELIRTGEVIEFEPRHVISIWPPRFYFDSLTLEEDEGNEGEAK